MSALRSFAKIIRHLPGLRRCNQVWNLFRPAYRKMIDPLGNGVEVNLGGVQRVRIPADFSGAMNYEKYEPDALSAAAGWLVDRPNAIVLDIGCAVGVFSLLALTASTQVEVLAFDADINSLQCTRRFCRHSATDRLTVILGFLSKEHESGNTLAYAIDSTNVALTNSSITGAVGTNRYTCLDENAPDSIPVNSLDGFLLDEPRFRHHPILIKCDVEGAELLVLEGAQSFIDRFSPDLLLSVHPLALPHYGHSRDSVRRFLDRRGYDIELLAVDHEEHWWCVKKGLSWNATQ